MPACMEKSASLHAQRELSNKKKREKKNKKRQKREREREREREGERERERGRKQRSCNVLACRHLIDFRQAF